MRKFTPGAPVNAEVGCRAPANRPWQQALSRQGLLPGELTLCTRYDTLEAGHFLQVFTATWDIFAKIIPLCPAMHVRLAYLIKRPLSLPRCAGHFCQLFVKHGTISPKSSSRVPRYAGQTTRTETYIPCMTPIICNRLGRHIIRDTLRPAEANWHLSLHAGREQFHA